MKKGKIGFGLLFFTVFILVGCSSTGKGTANGAVKKYALVIGNSNYEYVLKLKNPNNDAEDISKTLERFNYQVELCLDLDLGKMETAVDNFIENLSKQNNAEGFFYFAGQGARINGNNYMMPTDIYANNEAGLVLGSYGITTLLSKLITADNALNTVVIDACFTDFSFEPRHRGGVLVIIDESLSGKLENDGLDLIEQFTKDIFYLQAAMPGSLAMDGTGRNSPFTRALLENMVKPVPFIELVPGIIKNTIEYSGGHQMPYFKGNIFNYENYKFNL
jgi:uncharacterized caspase-like protein